MAKRRKNGEGTTYKDGKGWTHRVTDKAAKCGYRFFYGTTKELALDKWREWKDKETGTYSGEVNSSWTVGQWANYWYENYVVGKVKVTTQNDDRSILDFHVIPGIGHISLEDLTGIKLQRFYNDCCKKNNGRGSALSPKTIKNIYTVVNRMLKCAYNNDLIETNPNEKTKLPKRPKKEVAALTEQDFEKIIKSCVSGGTTLDVLIIFYMLTGVRLGEGLGLQWSKINFDKKTIRIDQQLQPVPNDDKSSKRKYIPTIIDSTKTRHSNRTLPVYDEVIQILKQVKHNQAVNKLQYGAKYRRDLDLVFCKDDGYFICDTIFRKFFNKKLEELGISHFRIHDLRHSYATRLFEDEIKPKLVSDYLGHSSVFITLDTYTHVSPEKLKDVVGISGGKFKKYFNNSEKEIPDEILHPKRDA